MPSPARIAGVVVLVVLLSAAWAVRSGRIAIADRYNPWAELDVAETPGLFTRMKLGRAQRDPVQCLASLEEAGMRFEAVPDRSTGQGCALENTVRLSRGHEFALSSPVLLSCRAALSFAMWERHVVQPSAEKHLGTRIARVGHLGGYACRDVVTGKRSAEGTPGRRSRHATADALDVASFSRVDGGREVVVRRDWLRAPAPGGAGEAAFLREVHQGGCRLFDGVLGPDYNDVHADHFHLELGGWHTCL